MLCENVITKIFIIIPICVQMREQQRKIPWSCVGVSKTSCAWLITNI